MKISIKTALAAIVVIAVFSAALLYWTQPGLFNVNPQPSATPAPSPSAEPTITISYHSIDLGCGRQCAEITITNQGYQGFSTNPEKFYLAMSGKNYSYTPTFTTQFGNWQNTTIANGASYEGAIVFNNPKATGAFTIGYDDLSYHIVYAQN